MNAIIAHGSYGSPEGNWIPWLKERLLEKGYSVFVPAFPTPGRQCLENWLDAFECCTKHFDEETILVGHSLGATFLLRALERIKVKVKACFFVAGFAGLLGNPEFDGINRTFVEKPFDWKKIRRHSGQFFVFQSDNDPYVSMENAIEIGKGLGAEPIIVKNAGHFNSSAGYNEFPLLLEKILSEQNSKI